MNQVVRQRRQSRPVPQSSRTDSEESSASRRRISVERNLVIHNGHGRAKWGERYHWITGGIFLYSNALTDVRIEGNTVDRNEAFQIAASQRWLDAGPSSLGEALARAGILVQSNQVNPSGPAEPVRVGWAPDDYTLAHALEGDLP